MSLFVAAAQEAHSGPVLEMAAPILYTVHFGSFALPITNTMVYGLIIGLVIFLVVRLGTSNLKEIPSGLQNFLEFVVESLENLLKGLLDPKVVRWAFPLIATYFIFILTSNLMGLVPGVGSIGWGFPEEHGSYAGLPASISHEGIKPLFRPPTSDANVTVAMATIFFVMSLFWAIRYNGLGGFLFHTFGPKGNSKGFLLIVLIPVFFAVGVIEIISLLIRPVALSMRLYGNIYGGESVMTIMLGLLPFGIAAIPFYFFELVVCIVQALVFTMLCVAFLGTMCAHTEDHEPHEGEPSSH